MYPIDEDQANEIKREEAVYYAWLKEQKNRILNITNYERKREDWKKVFPTSTLESIRKDDTIVW